MTIFLARISLLVAFGLTLVAAQDGTECSPMTFTSDSFVCACDESYCDFIGEVSTPDEGNYRRVISSRDSLRFNIVDGIDDLTSSGDTLIVINHDYEYQSMLGFGGAFTDSTGINIVSLSETLQNQLLRSYFSPSGIEYNIGRIPIAGCDFSTYAYSYDEVDGDVDLEYFALTDEDFNYKIPLIQKAIAMSNKEIRLFGSPWSPPAWMKENGMLNGTGGLLPEMRDPYANYLIKFVEAYESYNLTIWGITPQNEPLTGFEEDYPFNTCAWSAADMRDFIKNNMGPAFTAAGLRRIQVMILDHNRQALPWYPVATLEDAEANQYVDGVAVHWYQDADFGPEYLQETKALFPDKFLLYTEACAGFDSPDDERVVLGSWQRAENYAADIIQDVNNYVTGWVDWNMALSLIGGPNWVSNFVDSPIIVDPTNQVFYKQPMFYAMGHFSKFIPEGSRRMYSSVEGSSNIQAAAFHTDTGDVVVVLNTGNSSETISILNHEGNYINFEMFPKSLETVLFS